MKLAFVRSFDTAISFRILKILKLFNKKSEPDSKIIKNILCVKFYGMGNLVMILPSIRAIKEKYPDVLITFLTNQENKGLLENTNLLNKIIYFKMGGFFKTVFSFLRLINFIKKQHIDMAIDFEQFARSPSILLFLTGIKQRIGFNLPTLDVYDRDLYSKTVLLTNKHMVEGFGELVTILSTKIKNELVKLDTDKKYIENLKKDINKFKYSNIIGIHSGTGPNADVRKWDKSNFANLCDKLIKEKNCLIIFTGSLSETKDTSEIMSKMKEKNNVLDMSGKTNISKLISIISVCDYFISSDTGPIHIAAAQGIHCIGLYGPNTPFIYGPYTDKKDIFYIKIACSPCMTNLNLKKTDCKNNVCMQKINVYEVFDSIK
jgi:ADP-heptose:LPS heptosyltransferase